MEMPSIYKLKPLFQNLLRPIANWLAKNGVTANQLTIAAVVLSFLTGVILVAAPQRTGLYWFMPFALLLRMALNALDGMLAQEHNMKTSFGAILNELGDVVSDSFLYLPFALLSLATALLVPLIVIASVISEMTGVLGQTIGASRRYDGPMGKSDRAFAFGLISLLLAVKLLPFWLLHSAFILILVLIVWTIYNRVAKALAEINRY